MNKKDMSLNEKIKACRDINVLMGKNGLIQQLTKSTIETILNAELDEYLGYKKHEAKGRNSGDSRNGSSHKKIRSSSGDIELEIPRDRNGNFESKLIPKYAKSISSFDEKIISMYGKGLSTPDIQDHIKDIYGADISPAAISMITDKVVPLIKEWQNRKLKTIYAVVYFDAIYFYVHENNVVIKKAAYIAIGIDMDGKKDVLSITPGGNESASYWTTIFNDLKTRDVLQILITCIDGLPGLPEAMKEVFPKTRIQLCVIHMIRNSLKSVARKDKKQFMNDLKLVYQAETEAKALDARKALCHKWLKVYPKAVKPWFDHWHNVSGFYSYGEALRKTVYTTNIIESVNRQYRKVTKAKTIFPHDESLLKMLFLATRDIQKKWTGKIKNWDEILAQLKLAFGDEIMTPVV